MSLWDAVIDPDADPLEGIDKEEFDKLTPEDFANFEFEPDPEFEKMLEAFRQKPVCMCCGSPCCPNGWRL
jgi:hypothetical protein